MGEFVASAGSAAAKAAVTRLFKALARPSFHRRLRSEMIKGLPEGHPHIRWIDQINLSRLLASDETSWLLLDPGASAGRALADEIERAIDVQPPTGERRKLAEDLAAVARARVLAVLEQDEATAALGTVIQEVAARSAGRIHADAVPAARLRISQMNREERSRCLSGRPQGQLEPPPLLPDVRRYLSAEPWHERCRGQLTDLLAVAGERTSLSEEAAVLAGIDVDAGYDAVVAATARRTPPWGVRPRPGDASARSRPAAR